MTPLPRPQERLLLDLLDELPEGRLLCNTAGRAQFAVAYSKLHPLSPTTCWFLDLYQLQQSRDANHPLPPNLQLCCEADPPSADFDLVAWAFSLQGDGELTREMLQAGHQQLAHGGRLIATIDNPRDQWLHEQLRGLFSKVTRRTTADGVIYLATKTAPLRKLKTYAAEFAFRDGQQLIHLRTRPGVFNHRELDGGARALIKAMTIAPAIRVLDLGCGSGAVALAAALRAPDVQVNAIDSNSRAIESTLWAAQRNAVTSLNATLDCDGATLAPESYDLVLANPPYYSDFRIASLFTKIAARGLKPDASLLLVTKTPQWYVDHLPSTFNDVTTQPIGNYIIISARRAQTLAG